MIVENKRELSPFFRTLGILLPRENSRGGKLARKGDSLATKMCTSTRYISPAGRHRFPSILHTEATKRSSISLREGASEYFSLVLQVPLFYGICHIHVCADFLLARVDGCAGHLATYISGP